MTRFMSIIYNNLSIDKNWRREWQPTPVFLPGPMDRGAWWAIVHGVAESDMTERLSTQHIDFKKGK